MIILRPYEPKVLMPVPVAQWREPSRHMPKDCFGNPEWVTVLDVKARKNGRVVWSGRFRDRDDADAFLLAAVMDTLHIERVLCRIPDPVWVPGVHEGDLTWECATTTYYTSGTSWTVPADWNNSDNEIIAVGGGGNGSGAVFDGKGYNAQSGGGGGACSKAVNVTYTAGASRTRSIGAAAADTYLRDNSNSTNAVLAKAGLNHNAGTSGGAAASGTGSTKYSGGNGSSASGANGGAGGGAASTTANGQNGSPSGGVSGGASGAGNLGGGDTTPGSNGTAFGSSYGPGGGGGGATSGNGGNGGNYGGGGGSGAGNPGTGGGNGAPGLLVITYTASAASSMKTGFNMPKGW